MEQHAGTRPERLRHIGREAAMLFATILAALDGVHWRT
jgi:hypothetical protein